MRVWSLGVGDVADFDGGECALLRRHLRASIDKHGWKVLEDCPVHVQALIIELVDREAKLERMNRLF